MELTDKRIEDAITRNTLTEVKDRLRAVEALAQDTARRVEALAQDTARRVEALAQDTARRVEALEAKGQSGK